MRVGALLMALLTVLMLGCDSKGLNITINVPVNDGNDNSGGNDQPPDPTDNVTNLGTWVSAYADDTVQNDARGGALQYVASITLRRDGSALYGGGTVYRFYSSGTTARDKLTVVMSGSIAGDDATLKVQSATGASVYDTPSWRLRFSGSKMTGIYTSLDFSQNIVRSGHATWYRTTSSDTADALTQDWVSSFGDVSGTTTTWPARNRTALLAAEYLADDRLLSGEGSFVEQREGDVTQALSFTLSDTTVTMPLVVFTAGGLDMANAPMDWTAYHASGLMVGAYSQFNESNALVRCGRATWRAAVTAPEPADAEGLWVASFTDSAAAATHTRSDYLLALDLTAGADNLLTGSGHLRNEADATADDQTITVANGLVVGSHVTFEFRASPSQDRYAWDLRVTPSMLVGSYQRFDAFDRYISRGSAEWRRQRSSVSLVGTWVAAYVDTVNAPSSLATQLVMVNVSAQNEDGGLVGLGALRYANGETTRRLFRLSDSSVSATDQDVVWRWSGADLFGDTVWHMRQGTDALYGTYTNYTSSGAFESQGSAVWIRTTTTSSF